jgi:integrase
MAVYRPTYKDPKTGETVESKVWWYEFTFAGKRVRESSKSARKTVAIEAEKKRRLELERTFNSIADTRRERIRAVGEMIAAYLEHYPSTHREKSVVFATQRLEHVKRLMGTCFVCDLTEAKALDYIKTRLGEGVAGRTINMELGELSRAVGRKWSELWPKVRKLEERKDVGRALSTDEEERLLAAASGNDSPNRNRMLYTILRVALSTGMRIGEVLSLRWSQIDLTTNVLTVGRAKTSSGTGRQIPLNASLRAALDFHAAWYGVEIGKCSPERFVFPGRSGRPTEGTKRPFDPMKPTESIKTAWATLREASGVDCRLHDLRHTAATKMAEAGVPESAMLAIMGHMSRSMLERYSHVRLKAKREAVAALDTPHRSMGTPAKAAAERING